MTNPVQDPAAQAAKTAGLLRMTRSDWKWALIMAAGVAPLGAGLALAERFLSGGAQTAAFAALGLCLTALMGFVFLRWWIDMDELERVVEAKTAMLTSVFLLAVIINWQLFGPLVGAPDLTPWILFWGYTVFYFIARGFVRAKTGG